MGAILTEQAIVNEAHRRGMESTDQNEILKQVLRLVLMLILQKRFTKWIVPGLEPYIAIRALNMDPQLLLDNYVQLTEEYQRSYELTEKSLLVLGKVSLVHLNMKQ